MNGEGMVLKKASNAERGGGLGNLLSKILRVGRGKRWIQATPIRERVVFSASAASQLGSWERTVRRLRSDGASADGSQ
jgi:hypothetical protein